MKGKISAVVFKAMAVLSALAIGGGYVGWRQMEANKLKERERNEQAKAEDEDRLLLSGSKSYTGGTLLKEGELTDGILPPLEEGEGEDTPLLPGSKSIPMLIFTREQLDSRTGADSILPILEEQEPAPENHLPSSKIGILRLPKKEVEPPEDKPLKLLPGSKSIDSILKDLLPEKSE
jgi:autotransporter-associated beta strand protein